MIVKGRNITDKDMKIQTSGSYIELLAKCKHTNKRIVVVVSSKVHNGSSFRAHVYCPVCRISLSGYGGERSISKAEMKKRLDLVTEQKQFLEVVNRRIRKEM